MNVFVPFTNARKAMIVSLKGILTDPKNMKFKRNMYGNKTNDLSFRDYVIYAALRGADYRKTSHMEDGENARSILEAMLRTINNHQKSPNFGSISLIGRYCKQDCQDSVREFKELIEESLSAV